MIAGRCGFLNSGVAFWNKLCLNREMGAVRAGLQLMLLLAACDHVSSLLHSIKNKKLEILILLKGLKFGIVG